MPAQRRSLRAFTASHPFARWWVAGGVVALLLAGFGVALYGNSHRNAVYWAPIPESATKADCSHDGLPAASSGGGHVWVDSNPTGVVALWLPGLNAVPCLATLQRYDAARAEAIATAIRHAPLRHLRGVYNCPDDDEAEVALFFAYAGHSQAQAIQIRLSGCAAVGAPGRSARSVTNQLVAALRAIAPPIFAQRL